MNKLQEKQLAALNTVCQTLNEKKLPAKMVEASGEEPASLSILFSDLMEGDVFADLFFLPQKEEMDQLCFCVLQFELPGFDSMTEEQSLDLCIGCSMIGANLLLGGYSVETEDGELPVNGVHLRYTLPLLTALGEADFAEEIVSALSVMASDLSESGPKLLALAHGQMTTADFMEFV